MTQKIVVPEGMLKAAYEEFSQEPFEEHPVYAHFVKKRVPQILEAALRYLSENPIAPTEDQMRWIHFRNCENVGIKGHCDAIIATCVEWQRRMFLEPEEELPAELQEMFYDCEGGRDCGVRERLVAAYRIGLRNRKDQ